MMPSKMIKFISITIIFLSPVSICFGFDSINQIPTPEGYSNSYSIKKGAVRIDNYRLAPGDMYVQNKDDGIGHVSLIVDAAKNQENERVYLIGYGFIPAQEFHIEKSGSEHGIGGWFTAQGYQQYLSEFPFSRYGHPVLRRFE